MPRDSFIIKNYQIGRHNDLYFIPPTLIHQLYTVKLGHVPVDQQALVAFSLEVVKQIFPFYFIIEKHQALSKLDLIQNCLQFSEFMFVTLLIFFQQILECQQFACIQIAVMHTTNHFGLFLVCNNFVQTINGGRHIHELSQLAEHRGLGEPFSEIILLNQLVDFIQHNQL